MTSQAFPKTSRLLKRPIFLKVQNEGVRFATPHFVALALRREDQLNIEENIDKNIIRLGLTVSAKVGNAVVRNRIRRKLRDLFRRNQQRWPEGIDVVLIARSSAAKATYLDLQAAFFRAGIDLCKRFGART